MRPDFNDVCRSLTILFVLKAELAPAKYLCESSRQDVDCFKFTNHIGNAKKFQNHHEAMKWVCGANDCLTRFNNGWRLSIVKVAEVPVQKTEWVEKE